MNFSLFPIQEKIFTQLNQSVSFIHHDTHSSPSNNLAHKIQNTATFSISYNIKVKTVKRREAINKKPPKKLV